MKSGTRVSEFFILPFALDIFHFAMISLSRPKSAESAMPHSPATAVLLIAHGSRRAAANDDVRQIARDLSARDDYVAVQVAYLELASPSIPEAALECIRRGAQSVLLMPYFLSAGRHVVDDLVAFRAELAQTHPGVEFHLCPPLGLHPLMVQIVRDRLDERLIG